MSSKSRSLVQLPFDVLVEFASHLDIQDVLRLRQTTRQLREATYDRDVWASLYRRSYLPRSLGPCHTQTRQTLEDILLRSFSVHRNLSVMVKEPHFRTYDIGQETGVVVGSRYAFTINLSRNRIICRDLDSEAQEPTTVRKISNGCNFKFWAIRHFDVMTYSGRKMSLVLVEQREKDHDGRPPVVNSPVKVDLLRVIKTEQPEAGVHLEEIYQHSTTLTNPNMVPDLRALPSPNALVTRWKREGKAFLWDIEDLSNGPMTLTHKPHELNKNSPSYITCRTHLISFLRTQNPDTMITQSAVLDTVFARRSMHPTAHGVIPGDLSKIQMLRDSVVDHETGTTEVILSAEEMVFFFDEEDRDMEYRIIVIRLCIPSHTADELQRTLVVEVQTLIAPPFNSQGLLMSASWNGSTRLAYSHPMSLDYQQTGESETLDSDEEEQRWFTQINIAEIIWDEESQRARCSITEDVLIPHDAVDKFDGERRGTTLRFFDGERGGAMLRFFESEIGSGKLIFDYPDDDDGLEKHRLGVLDYAF